MLGWERQEAGGKVTGGWDSESLLLGRGLAEGPWPFSSWPGNLLNYLETFITLKLYSHFIFIWRHRAGRGRRLARSSPHTVCFSL